jgi:hypothetical protein
MEQREPLFVPNLFTVRALFREGVEISSDYIPNEKVAQISP